MEISRIKNLNESIIDTPEDVKYKENHDIADQEFDNVPVSLGKQHFRANKHLKLASDILNDEKVQILEFQRDIFPQEQQDKLLGTYSYYLKMNIGNN